MRFADKHTSMLLTASIPILKHPFHGVRATSEHGLEHAGPDKKKHTFLWHVRCLTKSTKKHHRQLCHSVFLRATANFANSILHTLVFSAGWWATFVHHHHGISVCWPSRRSRSSPGSHSPQHDHSQNTIHTFLLVHSRYRPYPTQSDVCAFRPSGSPSREFTSGPTQLARAGRKQSASSLDDVLSTWASVRVKWQHLFKVKKTKVDRCYFSRGAISTAITARLREMKQTSQKQCSAHPETRRVGATRS